MHINDKIYVAGHRGLVGSAILNALQAKGFTNIVYRTHQELDLTNAVQVDAFFKQERPQYVFLAAAHVGGIMANNTYRADFIFQNLAIQQNVIGCCFRYKVSKLLFLGSSCIYPRDAQQPLNENALLTSPLEYTNEPYAIAKIAGLKMCESFNIQYHTEFLSAMPTNLYGPNDNFHLQRSHLLPAIMRKMHLAKMLEMGNMDAVRNDIKRYPIDGIDAQLSSDKEIVEQLKKEGITASELTLWGSGKPLREMMWSLDMADACIFIMQNVSFEQLKSESSAAEVRNCHINVGTGKEHSIAQIAAIVQHTVGYKGAVLFDNTHPDGTPRKLLDVSKLERLGWKSSTSLEEGIKEYYAWYTNNK